MRIVWKPIPGYEGVYWVDKGGRVKNADEHILQPVLSKKGPRVELRKNGQRERVLVSDILCSSGWVE